MSGSAAFGAFSRVETPRSQTSGEKRYLKIVIFLEFKCPNLTSPSTPLLSRAQPALPAADCFVEMVGGETGRPSVNLPLVLTTIHSSPCPPRRGAFGPMAQPGLRVLTALTCVHWLQVPRPRFEPSSLFLLHGAEFLKRRAGGDRTLSSVHLGHDLPGSSWRHCTVKTQTAREPWVWTPLLDKVKGKLFPAAKTGWGVAEALSLANRPDFPDRSFP